MTAKRKVSTIPHDKMPSARKSNPPIAVAAPMPEWTEEEIDRRWDQIRIRGEQISAQIQALRGRIAS